LRIEGLVPVEHVAMVLAMFKLTMMLIIVKLTMVLAMFKLTLVKLNMAKSACYAPLPTQLIIWISLSSQQLDHL